ncbi:MAG: cobalt transporter [Cyanobacteria bacterium J06621_3]
MKTLPAFASVLALSLSLATPTLAHVGHGDEFQASGGVNRVEVKADTDALLGIQVNPIEAAADEGSAVLIPVTALVDDNGRQLVFVQYDNFYEPVDVVTGETQGELIEITEGLSVGEQLVSQGSLSLYAESRKTQSAEAPDTALETTTETTIIEETTEAPVAGASAAQTTEAPSSGFPVGIVVALAAIAAVGAGAVLLLKGKNSKKDFS